MIREGGCCQSIQKKWVNVVWGAQGEDKTAFLSTMTAHRSRHFPNDVSSPCSCPAREVCKISRGDVVCVCKWWAWIQTQYCVTSDIMVDIVDVPRNIHGHCLFTRQRYWATLCIHSTWAPYQPHTVNLDVSSDLLPVIDLWFTVTHPWSVEHEDLSALEASGNILLAYKNGATEERL